MDNARVLKSAGVMGIAVFLSRILGLVREQVFAIFFGASHASDAFHIAFRIPNLLRDLFAEGALSAALVPTFVRVQKEAGVDRGWQLASRVFGLLFGIVSFLAVLGVVFAEPLVRVYANAYQLVPGKFELTVQLTQAMMPFFPLVALAAAFMSILNAVGKFFIPSFASAVFNLVSIAVGVVGFYWAPRYGFQPIMAMAWGVVAGGLIQAAIQVPVLFRQGFRFGWSSPHPSTVFQDPDVRRMLLLMIPGTLGLAATQINILVNSIFATEVGPGAVSWLNYAFRLMQFPIGIFGVSLAAATLPMFSRDWAEGQIPNAFGTVEKSLKRVFAINLPASVGLAALSIPIIALIFERGRFTEDDTIATAQALVAYSIGLTGYSVVKVLVPVCYAMGKTRFAVISSIFSVFCNLCFNYLLVGKLGFVGLALGTSMTAVLNAMLIWFFSFRQMKTLSVGKLESTLSIALAKSLFSALLMGVLVWVSDRAIAGFLSEFFIDLGSLFCLLIRVGLGLLMGVGVYGTLAILLKHEESLELFDGIKRRLSNVHKKRSR